MGDEKHMCAKKGEAAVSVETKKKNCWPSAPKMDSLI